MSKAAFPPTKKKCTCSTRLLPHISNRQHFENLHWTESSLKVDHCWPGVSVMSWAALNGHVRDPPILELPGAAGLLERMVKDGGVGL